MSSPVIDQLTEAAGALGNFTTDNIVPDFENLMTALPGVATALSDAIKKLAGRIEDEMPVNNAVAEALREVVPGLGTLKEALDEANRVFRNEHRQELDQHHNARPNERAWNANA